MPVNLLPLVPLMTWMLSPAVILACTSVELLVPGITMSERDNSNMNLCNLQNMSRF